MDTPLAKMVNGKKFMWDGVVYESDESAQQVMEGYAKDGFEVQKFDEEGSWPPVLNPLIPAASRPTATATSPMSTPASNLSAS